MPDEAYYREDKFKPIREKFLAHVEKMFELAGISDAKAEAAKVMSVETALAKNHWDRVKSRDRTLTYNKMDRKALDSLSPGVDWNAWFSTYGDAKIDDVVVRQPDYFKAISKVLEETPLADMKAWLKWHVLHDAAPYLSKPFVDENFAFFEKTLTGAPEIRPRWKRAVALVEQALGEAVGKLYVAKHFPPAAKLRMQELVANLIEAYRDEIRSLDWMSAETRKRALEKLDKFTPKIGYTDKWRDYSKLAVDPDDLVGNARRAAAFEHARNLAKLGKPVDRHEWTMTPQTVNAYYNPSMNEIVFPAAILQPPFFDMNVDDAFNYGAIGAVIGHEIGHGFDDQGSKFDGDGNMKNWWTEPDRKEFESRAKKLIDQYSTYEPKQLPGQKVNGALTIGENIGDLGGLSIALQGVSAVAQRARGASDRWHDRRSAILHRLRPGVAQQVARCATGAADRDRPALTGRVSLQRRGAEYSRVLRRLRRQGGRQAVARAGRAGSDLVTRFTVVFDYWACSCFQAFRYFAALGFDSFHLGSTGLLAIISRPWATMRSTLAMLA